MALAQKTDIKALEKKVSALSNALAKLSSQEEFKELILILRRPGWTTPAELIFFNTITDAMTTHVATLAKMKAGLLKGSSRIVGEKG